MRALYENEIIGSPFYFGLMYGGRLSLDATEDFSKADYPGLRAIRILRYPGDPGEWLLAAGLADPYSITVGSSDASGLSIPGGILGYAETTTAQTGISTITDLTSLSVAVTAGAGRRLRVSGQIQLGLTFSATETLAGVATAREGSTTLGRVGSYIDNGSGSRSQLQSGAVILSPSAGAHTYKLSLQRTTGAGTVSSDAASGNPSYILVEDLGPATASGLAYVELYY